VERKMKAVRLFGPRDVKVVELPNPVPGYGEVLCKVTRCGICGTDYAIYSGDFSAVQDGRVKFPLQPGHEWCGVVIEKGEGVTTLQIGERVAGDTAISCGQCYECLTGNYVGCKHLRSVGTLNAWDGAMAEYVVFPARHLFKIPEGVGDDNAALAEPATTAMYAVDHAPIKPGDSVVVFGTGPIGVAAVSLAKIYGASKVISVGRSDFKLDLCRSLGATASINTTRQDVTGTINQMTSGKGVDVVIELSGAVELFNAGIQVIRPGGVISVVAFYNKPTSFFIDDMVFKNVTYKPVPGGFGMTAALFKLMEAGQVDLSGMITHRCSLDEVPQEIEKIKTSDPQKIKVMICR
jgi:2-desacetyl-2-hydroxyethyl bacteriochlorophyllide A dehydrogenase